MLYCQLEPGQRGGEVVKKENTEQESEQKAKVETVETETPSESDGDTVRAVASGAETGTEPSADGSPGGQGSPPPDLSGLSDPICGDPECLNLACLDGTPEALARASESLVPFVFACAPHEFDPGQFVDCSHPSTHVAFYEGEDIVVVDVHSNESFRVIYFERQRRASLRPYFTWYCSPIGPVNPATIDFMRSISS
jgi:hypothetical protein